MSEAGKYEGETCEGCSHWTPPPVGVKRGECGFHIAFNTGPMYPPRGGSLCDDFLLSLQCRQVRAMERIADILGRLDRVGITTWEGED
jgi:hypothetical protein